MDFEFIPYNNRLFGNVLNYACLEEWRMALLKFCEVKQIHSGLFPRSICVREISSPLELDTGKESLSNNSISRFLKFFQCLEEESPLKDSSLLSTVSLVPCI